MTKAYGEDEYAMMQELYSNASFKAEFDRCRTVFFPKVGEKAALIPLLMAIYREKDADDDQLSVAMHVIDHDDFNSFDTRATLLKNIGRSLAE